MRGKRLYRSGWTCALATLTVLTGSAHAASIYRLDPAGGGIAGIAAAGPEFVARSAWVDDARANSDGLANPGEKVSVRISLQNVGSADARDTRTTLTTDDPDADISTDAPVYSVWPVGLAVELGWNVTIAAAAEPHDVTAIVTVTGDDGGPWRFIVTFPVATAPLRFTKLDDRIEDPVPHGNGDGAVEPGERVRVGVRFRNDGAVDGVGVRVGLQTLDPDVSPIVAEAIHTSWPAGEERETVFLVDIAEAAGSHSASLFVIVAVDGVDPWQFSVIVPIVGHEPEFAFRSSWLFDPAPGGNRDGLATPGERVLPRVRLRNVGTGDAVDVAVTLSTSDPDVVITQGQVTHATWPAGVARNNSDFVLDIAPDATARETNLLARVTTGGGEAWEFVVALSIGAPRVEIAHRRSWLFDPEPGGNRDGSASPGERVLPVVRLLNSGPSTALNVLAALEFDDAAVTVIRGAMNRARWEPGAAFTHNGFAIRIASDATPHDVTAIVRVTADNGGPWEFPFVFPVVYRPVEFVQRNAWVFDPAPGGDGDGEMEAGERVFPRIRLRNVGVAEGRDVVVRLTTGNQHVTVVTGEVRHESWPAGEARNNDGFVVDIDRLTRPRDVAFGVSVEVDGAVRWAFRYTFPITSAPVSLVAESTWVYDPDRRDNIPEPGERVLPRLRLRNIGTEAATDLRATLVVTDPDITGPTAAASLDSLAVGHDWTVGSLWIDIAATAIPHDTVVVVIVTADNGGPWRVEIPVSVGAVSGLRVRSTNMSDDLPGGNDDGAANPGETVTITFSVGNDGTRALYNVQPSLSVDGSDIAVTGTVDPLESWTPTPGQRSRQFAFPIEVSASAQPRDVEVVLTVTADDADPFLYTLTVPIVVLPPDFTLRNAWVWEPIPGGGADGDVNPGERVFPRFRLMNIGPGAGSNVQASLVVLDSDVEVVSGFVTHDSWPVGVGRNNNGLVLDISPNATPHDVTLVLSVVADDAGPWGFSFTMPIVAAQVAPTALLANYPNPFNPETWIPFDLSEAADVMVSVYDMQGALVRRIDLGRLERGIYRSREDAVYWDGRDEIGERASSGLYLYELRAGGHREIRRMVVRK